MPQLDYHVLSQFGISAQFFGFIGMDFDIISPICTFPLEFESLLLRQSKNPVYEGWQDFCFVFFILQF